MCLLRLWKTNTELIKTIDKHWNNETIKTKLKPEKHAQETNWNETELKAKEKNCKWNEDKKLKDTKLW